MRTEVIVIHEKCSTEALLMSTHKICGVQGFLQSLAVLMGEKSPLSAVMGKDAVYCSAAFILCSYMYIYILFQLNSLHISISVALYGLMINRTIPICGSCSEIYSTDKALLMTMSSIGTCSNL